MREKASSAKRESEPEREDSERERRGNRRNILAFPSVASSMSREAYLAVVLGESRYYASE